jgi:hypothetical protein
MRAAARRAIEVVNGNLNQVQELQKRYADPAKGPAAVKDVADALGLDRALEQARDKRIDRLQALASGKVPGAPSVDRDAAPIEAEIELIAELRGIIAEAVPGVALLRGPGREDQRENFEAHPEHRPAVLAKLLAQVAKDCVTTRTALATGDLDVLRSEALVHRMRRELGIDGDPRRAAAVDAVVAEHERRRTMDLIGMAGASLLLLLVPGIGPYLAAAAGAAVAAVAWEDALDLDAAANAGVASREEARAAKFWATVDTVLAGLDVAIAAKGLKSAAVTAARVESFEAKLAKAKELSHGLAKSMSKAEQAAREFEAAAEELRQALRAAESTTHMGLDPELLKKVAKAAYYAAKEKVTDFAQFLARLKLQKFATGIDFANLSAEHERALRQAFEAGLQQFAEDAAKAGDVFRISVPFERGERALTFDEAGQMLLDGKKISKAKRDEVLELLDLTHANRGHGAHRDIKVVAGEANLEKGLGSRFTTDEGFMRSVHDARQAFTDGRAVKLADGRFYVRLEARAEMGRCFVHRAKLPPGLKPLNPAPFAHLPDVVEVEVKYIDAILLPDGSVRTLYPTGMPAAY